MDRLVSMLMNGFIRQLVKAAVNYGIDLAAGKGKPTTEMTREDREKGKKINDMANRAKDLQKISRRLF